MPLFDPNSVVVDVDPSTALEEAVEDVPVIVDGFEIIDEPAAIEETKEGFLDASEVDVIPAMPLPDVAQPVSHDQVGKHTGLGVGGFFAILVFVSILIYIFRKCRVLMNQGHPNYKDSRDHLSSLL